MKLLKKLALAAAVSSIALSASAMQPIADADLSKVAGQDGVSIAADLHISIGEFKYTDTSANGGSVSFNNIGINGTIAATLDVVDHATFQTAVFGPELGVISPLAMGATPEAAAQLAALTAFSGTGDVVKIAIPKIAVASSNGLNVTVGSITMGNDATRSFGAFAMNDIKLQGTTVYIWAH